MASATQDRLYETFVAVAGQQDPNLGGTLHSAEEIAASLSDTVKQLGELQGGNGAQATGSDSISTADTTSGSSASAQETNSGATSTAGTTSGSSASTQETNSGGASIAGTTSSSNSASTAGTTSGSTVESIATTVLESGLGMVPLIVGLMGLFGGGGTPAGPQGTPPLVKYAMPDPIYFEGADTGSDVSGADYDQMGMPRAYGAAPDGASAQAGGVAAPASAGSSGVPSGPSSAPAPQITVNVQAMDSQSFLDHSSEIAQAVRDAMLNCNSINDVVNDL